MPRCAMPRDAIFSDAAAVVVDAIAARCHYAAAAYFHIIIEILPLMPRVMLMMRC